MKHYKHKIFFALGLILAIISITLIIISAIYSIIESSVEVDSEIQHMGKAFGYWVLSLMCLIPSLLLFIIDSIVSYYECVNRRISKLDLISSILIIYIFVIDCFVFKGDAELIVLYIFYTLYIAFKCYINFINKSSKIFK